MTTKPDPTGINFEKWGIDPDRKNEGIFWGRVQCFGGWDHTFQSNERPPVWQNETDDELKMAIEQPYYPPAQEAEDFQIPEPLCFDAPSRSPFKNGITDRDRLRRKLQHRLKRKAAERERVALLISNKGFKPCRMKACNGRAHGAYGEKCPVRAAAGKKGGKSGTGASKARTGDNNGRTKRRSCCGTLTRSPHDITCSKAKISLRKDASKFTIRQARKEAIKKPEIEWSGFTVPPHIMGKAILRSIRGTCGGCGEEMEARQAERIHRADMTAENINARLICGRCY